MLYVNVTIVYKTIQPIFHRHLSKDRFHTHYICMGTPGRERGMKQASGINGENKVRLRKRPTQSEDSHRRIAPPGPPLLFTPVNSHSQPSTAAAGRCYGPYSSANPPRAGTHAPWTGPQHWQTPNRLAQNLTGDKEQGRGGPCCRCSLV